MRKILNETIKRIFKSSFTKNVIMITSGAAFAQAINILFTPIITRLYSPEEYGILSVYIAVLGTLSFVGSLNYEMGIPIVEDDDKAKNILVLCLLVLTTFSLVLLFILAFLRNEVLSLLNAKELSRYVLLIPLGLFLKGLYNIALQWAYRERNFNGITKTKLNQSVSKNLLKLAFGVFKGGSIGLIIGQVVGECSGIVTLMSNQLFKSGNFKNSINLYNLKILAVRYRNFPIYTTTRRYLGDITISVPILLLTAFYGSEVVGFYGLANSIIQLPMNIIGTSISDVYFAETASLKDTNPERILKLSNKLLKKLIIIGIFPCMVLIVLGPILFEIVFGSEWVEAGQYARLLSISIFARLIFKPISNIFDIFERQQFAFWINILRIFIVLLTFSMTKFLNLNSYWAVGLYSASMALIYFIQYLGAQKIIMDAVKLK